MYYYITIPTTYYYDKNMIVFSFLKNAHYKKPLGSNCNLYVLRNVYTHYYDY